MSETIELTETRESWVFLETVLGVSEPGTDIASHLHAAGIKPGQALWEITKLEEDLLPNRFGDKTGTVWFTLRLTPDDATKWDALVS